MAAPPAATPDESGLVVALAFGSIALSLSGAQLYRLSGRGAAAAPAAAPAAASAAAAAADAKPAARRGGAYYNFCSGVFAVSLAATAYAGWAVSRASSLRPYDPYAELGLPYGASEKDVTQAYRRLSKTAHPDRGGDKAAFHALERAHRALTDPAAMANLRDYGNPEGISGRAVGSVAINPLLVAVVLVVLVAIVFFSYRSYAASVAKAAAEGEGAAAGSGEPSSAKELKIARQRAMQEQDQRRREREARKHGSASPQAEAAAKPAVEKMD
jgi:hypothetical protein